MSEKNDATFEDTKTPTIANASNNITNTSTDERDRNNIRKDVNDVAKKMAAPPDGGWGWIVVVSSFFISVLVDGVCFTFGIFFDEFMDEFGTSKATTSWIGSVLNGAYLIFGPIVSALVNMYDCRRVAMVGSVLAFVAFFVSTFSSHIGVFIFTYGFLGGVGFGLMYLPAIVMVGYYFERRRALATGIACCGSGIGAFLFAPFTEYLLQEYGWRGGTWILAALIGNGVIFALFYKPLSAPSSHSGYSESEGHVAGTGDGQGRDETVKLLMPSSEAGDEMIDMTTIRPNSKDRSLQGQARRGLSEQLRTQIYERLISEPDASPVYRTRSMTLDSPQAPTETKTPTTSHTARLAFSQDFSIHHRKRAVGQGSDPTHGPSVPPLQRKDIFYSGSLWHLKEYKEVGSVDEYRKKVLETADQSSPATSPARKSFIQSFISVFDVSLLRSPTFLFYGASCFLCMAGFFVPFIYMPTYAMDMGLDSKSAAFLISIIGITNTVSRVAVGFISDQPWADCLLINNVALIIGGVATLFVPYYSEYYLLGIYSAVFGTAIAVFVSLRSIIMVELMGLERLTTAFGFVIMCQGLSSLLGPPVAGALSDSTGNYNAAFYLAGITLALSGIICLPLRRIAKWEFSKQNLASAGQNSGRPVTNSSQVMSDQSKGTDIDIVQ